MDFFDHQDRARRNTGRLVVLFVLAVLGILASTYLVVAAVLTGASGSPEAMMQPPLLAGIGLGVLAVVGGGSLFKLAQLAAGGQVVALHLGGRLLSGDTRDPVEQRVLNVVEEMAIASGTPVPPVYLLDNEPNINAFAAGYSPGDAVIGITRGCAEKLNRDQLQGVVAHEFSHILNGDMRLNIRLIGILHGILLVGIVGYYLLRSGAYGHRSSSRKGGNPLPLMGLGLMLVGFIGTFFGNMIKAAVSRQREFLADASAVQFTRNPDGIAGALKVIGGYEKGSSIFNANAPEASHMFFGQAITSGLAGLFATHPPLDERIRRIDRYWEAQKAMRGPQPATALAGAPIAGFAQGAAAHAPPPRPAIEQAGQPTEAHIAYAHQLLEALPGPLVNAAHEPYSARALIYAMLVGSDGPVRQSQIELIDRFTDKAIAAEARKLLPLVEQLDPKARLPLVDVAIGTLAKLTAVQYADFAVNVDELVRADRRISLFEWVIQRVLVRHLEPRFRKSRRPMMKYGAIDPVLGHASSVLSAMAYIGHRTPEQAARAIEAGRRHLSSISLLSLEECGLDRLGRALDELALLAPKPKRTLLKAAAAVIAADHQVTIGEAELFRGIADSLGVPVPPLLPGQDIV